MPHYTAAYPALAPLVSGRNDNPAPPIAAGAPLNALHVIQTTAQHQTRKILRETQQATPTEVVASRLRKAQVVAEHAAQGFGPAPAWAVALQNAVTTLTTTINNPQTGLVALGNKITEIQATVNNPQTGLVALGNKINDPQTGLVALGDKIDNLTATVNNPNTGLRAVYNETVRSKNAGSFRISSPNIAVLRNDAGDLPGENDWFPHTFGDLVEATHAQMNSFFAFYQQEVAPNATLSQKRALIKDFLAID